MARGWDGRDVLRTTATVKGFDIELGRCRVSMAPIDLYRQGYEWCEMARARMDPKCRQMLAEPKKVDGK